jgi:hypothetical protein
MADVGGFGWTWRASRRVLRLAGYQAEQHSRGQATSEERFVWHRKSPLD